MWLFVLYNCNITAIIICIGYGGGCQVPQGGTRGLLQGTEAKVRVRHPPQLPVIQVTLHLQQEGGLCAPGLPGGGHQP